MGRHCERNKRTLGTSKHWLRGAHRKSGILEVAAFLRSDRGQGTVEFALVTAAFLIMIVAGGVAWNAFGGGILVEHALLSSSHHIRSGVGVMADVFAF